VFCELIALLVFSPLEVYYCNVNLNVLMDTGWNKRHSIHIYEVTFLQKFRIGISECLDWFYVHSVCSLSGPVTLHRGAFE
jgi:hypothetical protein